MKLTKTVVFFSLVICVKIYPMQNSRPWQPVVKYGQWQLPSEYDYQISEHTKTEITNGTVFRWIHKANITYNNITSIIDPLGIRESQPHIPPLPHEIVQNEMTTHDNGYDHFVVSKSALQVIVTFTTIKHQKR